MDNFFDNLCRTLAAPMSRKRALKLMAGGLVGAVLAPFAFGQKNCKSNCVCGGNKTCCSPGQTCYKDTSGNGVCCGPGYQGYTCNKNGKSVVCLASNSSTIQDKSCTALTTTTLCS